jgi:hypothetical protein
MATKKTVKKLAKQVKKNNKAFEKMEPNEKRIAIAKDVIAQLNSEKFLAAESCYLSFEGDSATEEAFKKAMSKATEETEFRDILKKVPQCEVCARGAMFASAVRLFNDFNVGAMRKCEEDGGDSSPSYVSIKTVEKRYFSKLQVGLIELAFEGESNISNETSHAVDSKEGPDALRMFDFYPDVASRMIAIMQNIIDNGGKFVPSKDEKTNNEKAGVAQ